MGLDTVELVMEIEEAFDVYIPDAEAEQMRTVGDVYQYLLRQKDRPVVEGTICLTSACFYRIRRALMKTFKIPRRTVRPESRFEVLIPRPERRSGWIALSQALMLPLPALRRPAWVKYASWISVLLLCGLLLYLLLPFLSFEVIAILGLVALMGGVALFVATEKMRYVIPAACYTVGDMAEYAVIHHEKLLTTPSSIGSPEEVWLKLKGIIVKTLGVRPEDVRPEARWYQDLGAG